MNLVHHGLAILISPLMFNQRLKKEELEEKPLGAFLDVVCPQCDQRGFECTVSNAGMVLPVCLHCGLVGEA